MIKIQKVLLAALICFQMMSLANVAMAQEESHRDVVIGACQKLSEASSYHLTMVGTISASMKGSNAQVDLKSEMDVLVQPFLSKSATNITINTDGKVAQESFVQYMEMSEKKISTYSYMNGKWQRLALPGWDYNPARDFAEEVKAIKSVALLSKDDKSAVYEVTADGKYLNDLIKNKLGSLSMKQSDMELLNLILGNLGDFTYTLTIDKSTGNLTGMDMDLSKVAASIGNSIVNKLPEDKKQDFIDMFNGMQVKVSFTLSQIGSVEPFAIPDEARGN